MRLSPPMLLSTLVLGAGCAGSPEGGTLADLRDVEPDLAEVRVEDGLDRAMRSYERFLSETPESQLTPEAMRRLADLKLEQEFGILGDGGALERPAAAPPREDPESPSRPSAAGIADLSEPLADFERRASAGVALAAEDGSVEEAGPAGGGLAPPSGPLEAIELYDRILATYPDYAHNDRVLYQKARAYDELGRTEEAMAVMEQLVSAYPRSSYTDEVQFRRAEYFFTRRRYREAEDAYGAITAGGESSEYYELALYKLGWTLYKQDMHEEALDQYVALLDYRVSIGSDLEHSEDQDVERRIADTFRVISLSFSYLGGPDAVQDYFAQRGARAYEDRIYSHLGEFYLDKLRYHDAARVYRAFVALYPMHRSSPAFGMRVIEIYEAGGFPMLVLEAKKGFANRYALDAEYWQHFEPSDRPEVLAFLRSNLEDLAGHYHALYQDAELAEERPANFDEATRWYRVHLDSFPADPQTPSIHHRLADLLLENEDFGAAAREYERTAYHYAPHAGAAGAGYAAIFAHREAEKRADGVEREEARRRAVESTLRFVDVFPDHEHAAVVLGAAVDDLYAMGELERTVVVARRLIDEHPEADPGVLRGAWNVLAHASFDRAEYAVAEEAYGRTLEMLPPDEGARRAAEDNLAASIYQQGELASQAGDHRVAAEHFLRIQQRAPDSEIRATAEYDAAAALIRLEDWSGAGEVLEAFRRTHPDHELHREATRQIAFVRRQEGDLLAAAREYERVASETDDRELAREAQLVAGELYEEKGAVDRALAAYETYVERFEEPLELAVETRFKISELHREAGREEARRDQLRRLVEVDAEAGEESTPRMRHLAARSALVLSVDDYERFEAIALVRPLEENLLEKRRRMDVALEAFDRLVDYEDAEITAAATFYMAEIYFDFSGALLGSERPVDLGPAELQDYEMVLEEEAFPFEERSIAVHEKNLELMRAGVYNTWVERSLAALAERMPGRYAKAEATSGFLASLELYVYHPPGSAAPTAAATQLAVEPAAADAPVAEPAHGEAPAPSVPPPASQAEDGGDAAEAASGASSPEPIQADAVGSEGPTPNEAAAEVNDASAL